MGCGSSKPRWESNRHHSIPPNKPHSDQVTCGRLSEARIPNGTANQKPAEQILSHASQSEDIPIFASNGDLFFRASERSTNYLYRLAHDEQKVAKVTPDPIVEPQSVSPDGTWIVTQIALPEKQTLRGVVAYSSVGATSIRLCEILCFVSWSADGKYTYIHLPGTTQFNELGKTYLIPIRGRHTFPALPRSGIRSEADLLKLQSGASGSD